MELNYIIKQLEMCSYTNFLTQLLSYTDSNTQNITYIPESVIHSYQDKTYKI